MDYDNLINLLIDTNMPIRDIAKEFEVSEVEVRRCIKEFDLGWIRKRKSCSSRGQAAMLSIMQKLIPGEEIRTEEYIGSRLRLDVYCPKYKLAAEFHGRQHFEFVQFFHKTYEDFLDAQKRDIEKIKLCKELGIALIIFRYDDILSEDAVFDRLLNALKSTAYVDEHEDRPKKPKPPYYEQAKERQRQYRRAAYQRIKEYKKAHDDHDRPRN